MSQPAGLTNNKKKSAITLGSYAICLERLDRIEVLTNSFRNNSALDRRNLVS